MTKKIMFQMRSWNWNVIRHSIGQYNSTYWLMLTYLYYNTVVISFSNPIYATSIKMKRQQFMVFIKAVPQGAIRFVAYILSVHESKDYIVARWFIVILVPRLQVGLTFSENVPLFIVVNNFQIVLYASFLQWVSSS